MLAGRLRCGRNGSLPQNCQIAKSAVVDSPIFARIRHRKQSRRRSRVPSCDELSIRPASGRNPGDAEVTPSIRAAVAGEKKRSRRGKGASPPCRGAVCTKTETVSQGLKRAPPASGGTIKPARNREPAPTSSTWRQVRARAVLPGQGEEIHVCPSGFGLGSAAYTASARLSDAQTSAAESSRVRQDNDLPKDSYFPGKADVAPLDYRRNLVAGRRFHLLPMGFQPPMAPKQRTAPRQRPVG